MPYLSPGVYVESEKDTRVLTGLVTPSRCYMLGTAISGTLLATTNEPVSIASLSDFSTKFGADSPSYNYVSAYFQQINRGLFFINVDFALTSPTVAEIQTALSASLDINSEMGLLIAPEFFAATRTDYGSVANALIATADETYNIAVIDPGNDVKSTIGTSTTGVIGYVASLTKSDSAITYFPYLEMTDGNTVPPSPVVAGMSLAVWSDGRYGIRKSPAGFKHPFKGVSKPLITVSQPSDTDLLNPLSINSCVSKGGISCAYGARTLATNLTFINTSVILKVQTRSLKSAMEDLLFDTVDTRGELFRRASAIAEDVLSQQWIQGQLAGATPLDAYRVICDTTNNTPESLSAGILNIDIYQTPAGTVEVVVIVPHRVPFGSLAETVANRV